jgi:uncharacterized membrane protein
MNESNKPLITAGIVLGIGMGGFVDGIVFHQILQTHAMLSAQLPKTTIPNIEINMFWDGLFHALTWLMTAAGLALLWRAVKRPQVALLGKHLLGAMSIGWGLFNLVEGLLDHYILHLHHVVEARGLSMFDHAFLAFGVVLCLTGWLLIRSAKPPVVARPSAAAPGVPQPGA